MHVFLTGASGYLGSRVAARLLEGGHVRHRPRAPSWLRSRRGFASTLATSLGPTRWPDPCARPTPRSTPPSTTREDFAEAVATERAALDAMLAALRPKGTLIATSAAGVLGDTGARPAPDEAAISADFPARIRGFVEERVRRGRPPTGRAWSPCACPCSSTATAAARFVPGLIAAARRDGVSRIAGDGANRMSSVHVDDAAEAYVAALDRGCGRRRLQRRGRHRDGPRAGGGGRPCRREGPRRGRHPGGGAEGAAPLHGAPDLHELRARRRQGTPGAGLVSLGGLARRGRDARLPREGAGVDRRRRASCAAKHTPWPGSPSCVVARRTASREPRHGGVVPERLGDGVDDGPMIHGLGPHASRALP